MSKNTLACNTAATRPCDCGCCHQKDFGACDSFEKGMNGRCVYCDHGENCHGPQNNAKRFYNAPLGVGVRKSE